jgi:hypothetical protein
MPNIAAAHINAFFQENPNIPAIIFIIASIKSNMIANSTKKIIKSQAGNNNDSILFRFYK